MLLRVGTLQISIIWGGVWRGEVSLSAYSVTASS